MNRLIRIFLLAFILFYFQKCEACGEDCPGDCENKYKCVDRSEICHQMKENCENFFFRKCMRCACPKTCGVCGDSSSSEEEETSTTTSTYSPSPSTNGTEMPSSTTPEEVESSTPEEVSSPEPPSTPQLDFTSPEPIESSTMEEISDAEFNDPAKMKCKSCDAKRKKLAEIYEKYYPKE